MAGILNLITIGEKKYYIVNGDPAIAGGTEAEVGSVAIWEDNSNIGKMYLKVGPLDTDWDKISTSASSGIGQGDFLRLPIYNTDANGYSVDDTVQQNSQSVSVKLEAQPSRSADIEYRIPNPGNAIAAADFVLTEGNQLISGDKEFQDDVVIEGDLTVKGTLTSINSTNTEIQDELITLNKGGLASSAGGAGIEFEENDIITAYVKINAARTGYEFLAPAQASQATLLLSSLTSNREFTLPNESGTMALGTGAAGRVSFWSSANTLSSNSVFVWDNTNGRLGIGNSTPSSALHVTGSTRITSLNLNQPVRSDTLGNLTNSLISLTADVSGTLPIANGGTNSSTALNNNRIMVSSAGSIVEAAALTNGQLLIGSTGAAPVGAAISGTANQVNITNGAGSITLSLPQDIATTSSPTFVNATLSGKTLGSVLFVGAAGLIQEDNSNFFWNDSTNRLGLATNTPLRLLDVNGSSIFRDSIRLAYAAAPNANFEMFQAQVSTTDATVTTIATVAIPTDSVVMLKAKIVGRRTGGTSGSANDSAIFERTARFKNNGGTVTIHNLQSDYTSEDQGIFDGTLAASGTNALIRVRGAANNNMNWSVTYEVIIL
jgi:hypothetical protein